MTRTDLLGLTLMIMVAYFGAVGIYRTLVKPDKPWHRWGTLALLTVLLLAIITLPAWTGWELLS